MNNFIVSEHIELACFLSHFIELKVQSGSVPFTKLFFSFEYWGKLLDKSKSKIQNRHETEPSCSPQNWTSVFLNRNSVLKVPSGSVFWKSVLSSRTTRANPVFKSSISNWRFPNRTEDTVRVCLSCCRTAGANPVFKHTNRTCLPQN